MAVFNEMLKYLRVREHLSQAELATKLGISKSSVSMYEVGKREPDFETLENIADFFNVDMNFLLGKGGSENNEKPQPHTIAAHFDGDEYTEEQLERIKAFASFIKSEGEK